MVQEIHVQISLHNILQQSCYRSLGDVFTPSGSSQLISNLVFSPEIVRRPNPRRMDRSHVGCTGDVDVIPCYTE
jgi:hypothetical protein